MPEDFIKKNQEKNEVTKEEPEHEYFADFMANRISLKLFPISIWNQMLRQALYDNSDTLFKTIPYNGIYELREAIADYLHKKQRNDSFSITGNHRCRNRVLIQSSYSVVW